MKRIAIIGTGAIGSSLGGLYVHQFERTGRERFAKSQYKDPPVLERVVDRARKAGLK